MTTECPAARVLARIFAVLAIAYGLFLAGGSPAGFPATAQHGNRMPYLADIPLGEDAFYMLHVAWNLGAGHGAVCNEGTSVTGIQPLATLVYAGVAWADIRLGGDQWMFLRLVLALNVLLLLAFAECVGRLAAAITPQNRESAHSLGILLTALSFTAFRHFTYGLETGMYLTAFAATILFTLRPNPFRRMRDAVALGLLAGLCGWCRIDFGLCFAIFLLTLLLTRRLSLPQCLLAGSVALLTLLPWFAWVGWVSGTPMPSSGAAEFRLIHLHATNAAGGGLTGHNDRLALRLAIMAMSVADNLVPCLDTAGRWPLVWLKGLTCLAGLTALVIWRRRLVACFSGGTVGLAWALAILALVPVYLVCFCSVWFYFRYTTPLLLLSYPIFAAAGAGLLAGWLRTRRLALLGVLLSCLFAAFAAATIHGGRSWYGYTVTAGFIQRHLAHVPKVGAFQCGKIGFFCPNVVNLDGKVNAAVLPFIRNGNVQDYLDRAGIDMLVDWPACIRDYIDPAALEAHGWKRAADIPGSEPPAARYVRGQFATDPRDRAQNPATSATHAALQVRDNE